LEDSEVELGVFVACAPEDIHQALKEIGIERVNIRIAIINGLAPLRRRSASGRDT